MGKRQITYRVLRMGVAGAWLAVLLAGTAHSQTLAVPPDSPRWDLQGEAKAAEYLGRKCLLLDGGAAVLKDFEMRDAVIDVDVATPATRGFFGFDIRIEAGEANYEEIYLRQHKSGLPDAMQYTPVLHTGRNWQIYNGPGFTGAVEIPKGVWFHLRLEVTGAQAKLFVKDMEKPALVMDDLKSGVQKGQVALFTLTGETYFSNFEIRATPDAVWQRHLPAMQPNILTRWSISPAYDGLQRNLERPLTAAESATISWEEVEAEPPGFVVLYRYRDAPHPRVTFQGDFSKRLEPQPGMKALYARTTIDSDREQVKKLEIGYSDDVSVFLNGKILYRGRSAQGFRDPGFLGIVNPENDAVYLPLKKGRNELMLALSELGGGWGFICRLTDVAN
ncbi:MAG TPA: hypothetical protein VFI38_10950 [Candidatus Acidoferrum sp.]|nr:hypothetical protein [Candidatus Acidoferrum sp.]